MTIIHKQSRKCKPLSPYNILFNNVVLKDKQKNIIYKQCKEVLTKCKDAFSPQPTLDDIVIIANEVLLYLDKTKFSNFRIRLENQMKDMLKKEKNDRFVFSAVNKTEQQIKKIVGRKARMLKPERPDLNSICQALYDLREKNPLWGILLRKVVFEEMNYKDIGKELGLPQYEVLREYERMQNWWKSLPN